jgi:hypothetical protein
MKKPSARDLRLLTLYGITEGEYARVLQFQGGRCAICQRAPKRWRLGIDHDHKTGLFRGLLCMLCNRALALLQDNAETAVRASEYIYRHPATLALDGQSYGRTGRVTRKWRTRRERAERAAWVRARLRELGLEVPRRLEIGYTRYGSKRAARATSVRRRRRVHRGRGGAAGRRAAAEVRAP